MTRHPNPRRRMVTIQDIAADLGLSAMTVSRALNDHPDVKAETRRRVEERARELNYRPNRWARSLVTQRSHVIGVVIPDITHTFFADIMGGVQEMIEAEGYTLMLCHSGGSVARERREIDMLMGSRADGLIVASTFDADEPELFADLHRQGVPFVLVDRFFDALDCARVHADDRLVGELAARHVLELGHRRVAFLKGPPVSPSIQRLEGFREALAAAGVEPPPEYLRQAGFGFDEGYREMRELLRLSARPTAVCAVNDPAALGALRACQEAGLDVPSDISITGAGAIEPSYLPFPFLTTTIWPRDEVGRQAAGLLLDLIAGRTPERQDIVVKPHLVERLSTAPPSE